jgi:hypothetical protein
MRVSYLFVNCSDIILPETEQVAVQPNSSAPRMAASPGTTGKSTVFVSSAFCCRLCDRAEMPDRVALSRDERRGPASGVDPDGTTRHRARYGQARRQGATRSTGTSRIAHLIGIDFIAMM